MRYLALATDYDGTLADEGVVDEHTVEALERARKSGRRLIMVTGRRLPDLLAVFPSVDLFDRVVVENGALLYYPASRRQELLAPPPPPSLVQRLLELGVAPVDVGEVIIATSEPFAAVALQATHELGLEYQVFFNKGAAMLLPPGVNKGTGLAAALRELDLSPHNVVAVGDAENDHSLLDLAEAPVAVANALPAILDRAAFVTASPRGAGVAELIDDMIQTDLAPLAPRLTEHDLLVGVREDGTELKLPAYGENVMVAGTSGGGKSTFITGLIERMSEHCYQFCLIDPEGDYDAVDFAVIVGSGQIKPRIEEVLDILNDPRQNVIVNLLAVPFADRPSFFDTLFPRLEAMRSRTGRPHWILLDEAHHLLPVEWELTPQALPQDLTNMVFVTLDSDSVSSAVLQAIDVLVTVGKRPEHTLQNFTAALHTSAPSISDAPLPRGKALAWSPADPGQVVPFTVARGTTERRRHTRKYARGDMGLESFYFRGPQAKLNLRARNLMSFLELADGVDDETWLYHLRQGDYSRWFREMVKDQEMALEAAAVEGRQDLTPRDSRRRVREAVERRYTVPA